MSFNLHNPQKGDRISASKMAALMREVRSNRLLQSPGVRVWRGPNGTHINIDIPKSAQQQPIVTLPYAVRFDPSLNSSAGGWKIYLPGDHLLALNGGYIARSDMGDVTSIEDGDGNATDWYALNIALSASHVYLVFADAGLSSSGSSVSATFKGSSGPGTSICIADISYTAPATAGAAPTVDIVQNVIGAISVFKSPPGNFEPSFAADTNNPNTIKLNSVGGGYWPYGRRFYSSAQLDNSAKIASGLIYLEVTHPTSSNTIPSVTIKGGSSLPTPTDSASYIPLYDIDSGAIATDYRSCMSLTMREL